MDYNKTTLLVFNVSGASAGNHRFDFSFPSDFMVKRIWTAVTVAGAAAGHTVFLTNVADVAIPSSVITVGTAVAGTTAQALLTESERHYDGGTIIRIANATNSASSVYNLYVLCAHQE